jgi:hypothetical protein
VVTIVASHSRKTLYRIELIKTRTTEENLSLQVRSSCDPVDRSITERLNIRIVKLGFR